MPTDVSSVLRLAATDRTELSALLARFGLKLVLCAPQEPIPGSYWGDDEAGLRGDCLYARADSPLHSILHETCHYICMSAVRRRQLDTNAGSDEAEENAVCYLQILLAGHLSGMGRARMFADMDAWGYSFRLGSSRGWFEQDATDALQWLLAQQLVDQHSNPRWRLRS